MVLELHFYFIYLEAWWQDKLYHTHQYRIYKTSEQHKISYHNPRSPMPLSLGISMYDVDIKIHVFQHCNIQIFSVHIGDWFFFYWTICWLTRMPNLSPGAQKRCYCLSIWSFLWKYLSWFCGICMKWNKSFQLLREFIRLSCKPIWS